MSMFRNIHPHFQNAHAQQAQQHYPPSSPYGVGGGQVQQQQNVHLNGSGGNGLPSQGGMPSEAHGQGGGSMIRPAGGGGPGQPGAGGPGSTADGQSNSASGGVGMGQEMNLAGVLHYLQSEWRRWERDRNEWEIERAEMRARIALLEGQRRSAENLKVDLLRRVKMLEYALRQERTRTVGTAGSRASAIAPSRLSALQDEDKASSKDEREGSASDAGDGGSEEGSSDRPKPNGVAPIAMSKSASVASQKQDTNTWKNLSAVPRDPKSRARSREYLKQCLQEITYLTSPGALNPLPPGAPVSVDRPSSPAPSSPDGASRADKLMPQSAELADRPRKVLLDQPPPSRFIKPEPDEAKSALPNGTPDSPASTESTAIAVPPSSSSQPPSTSTNADAPQGSAPNPSPLPQSVYPHLYPSGEDASSPSRPAPVPLPDEGLPTVKEEPSDANDDDGKQTLTAIYRPESKAAWREELRAANEMAEKAQAERSAKPVESATDEEQLASLTFTVEEESVKPDDSVEQIWSTKRSLRSHLDVVRAVDFAHGAHLVFASGGDDDTVKVWSLDSQSVLSSKWASMNTAETEPIITYRGHTGPVTSVVVSSALGLIFSAGTDSTIRIWKIPPPNHDPYAPHDPSMEVGTLEGHTDAIWDLCLLPSRETAGSKRPDFGLVSASTDGSLRHWVPDRARKDGTWSLRGTWRTDGNPTCLSVCRSDFSKVLVGMADGTLREWSVETGQQTELIASVESGSQVNAILSHPTLPLIVTGHEDGYIRFHDLHSGSSKSSTTEVLAHPGAITSIALSPRSPMFVVTASTDTTLRIWDIARKQSVQDLHGHRARSDEGVTSISSHPELPIIASAGADGVIRLWGAG